MNLNVQHLSKVLNKTHQPTISMDTLLEEYDLVQIREQRTQLVASTIEGLLASHSVFNGKPSLRKDLARSLTLEGYYQEIIPKISFGRRQHHTTGACRYIADNPNTKILFVTCFQSQVDEIKKTLKEFNYYPNPNCTVASVGSSHIGKIPRGVEVILVEEPPRPNTHQYASFLHLVEYSILSETPLIVLGTII